MCAKRTGGSNPPLSAIENYRRGTGGSYRGFEPTSKGRPAAVGNAVQGGAVIPPSPPFDARLAIGFPQLPISRGLRLLLLPALAFAAFAVNFSALPQDAAAAPPAQATALRDIVATAASRTCAGPTSPTTKSSWTASTPRPAMRPPGFREASRPRRRSPWYGLSGTPGERTRARGLRRVPMGRPPPGLEGPERRSRALRPGAHGLRDASRIRSAHRADQPATLSLRPERRGEEIATCRGSCASSWWLSADVSAVLDGVEPPFGGYRRTEAALVPYTEMARRAAVEALPVPAKAIKPGEIVRRRGGALPAPRPVGRPPGRCGAGRQCRRLRRRARRRGQALSAPPWPRRRRPARAGHRPAAQRPARGSRPAAAARAGALALAAVGVPGAIRSS